jgi:hypothetical protein
MNALIHALDNPENVDITILDKLKTSSGPTLSLNQLQALKGVLIGIGILGLLIILALLLQQFQR